MALDDDCLFCKIIREEIPSTKVFEDEHVFAFDDINGQAPVHVLVIPKTHIATCDDATEAEVEAMGRLFLGAQQVAKQKKLGEGGYRMVMNNGEGAGQSVFHIHLHVIGGRSLSWPPG
ncbi:MAG: histidine triad nucleotide-binding protein [Deltaproteobacteria bacterium]|nr:histidine triad nucleotide-binding protein [Deltaproteobacteria bacterium]